VIESDEHTVEACSEEFEGDVNFGHRCHSRR
jgi:hypothetical protein